MVSAVGQIVLPADVTLLERPLRSPADLMGLTPDKTANRTGARTAPRQFQAGFGRDTISGPAAAFNTLDKGLTAARRTVPRVEELDKRRLRIRKKQEAAQRQGLGFRQLERRRLEASASARAFISQVDKAAETAAARQNGGETDTKSGGASIEVGGAAVTYASKPTGANFDIHV